jgi:hypothetical protein
MNEKEQLAWSSFMPALMACVASTSGCVLELGVGHFSTPTLHAICGASNRYLLSVEQNKEWLSKFEKLKTDGHSFWGLGYDEMLDNLPKFGQRWGVAFIDNSPGGARRAKDFLALIKTSDFVIVHDYWQDNEEHIAPLLKNVKYTHVTRTHEPPTLVASLDRPIPSSIIQL